MCHFPAAVKREASVETGDTIAFLYGREGVDRHHSQGRLGGRHAQHAWNPYDGHTLFETLEQVAILTEHQPREVFVDLGYRGAEVQAGTKTYHHKLKRDITARLRRDIRRRSAIEPAIGHMKNDGRLRRNWLKGTDGDAFHALLCGCGHNLRMILRKLRLLFALIAAAPIWRQYFIVQDQRQLAGSPGRF